MKLFNCRNISKPPQAINGDEFKLPKEETRENNSSDQEEDQDDSAIQDMSMDLSYSEPKTSRSGPSCSLSAQAAGRHKASTVTSGISSVDLNKSVGKIIGGKYTKIVGNDAINQAVVDLSKQRDSDLSISSPLIYTTQVRFWDNTLGVGHS